MPVIDWLLFYELYNKTNEMGNQTSSHTTTTNDNNNGEEEMVMEDVTPMKLDDGIDIGPHKVVVTIEHPKHAQIIEIDQRLLSIKCSFHEEDEVDEEMFKITTTTAQGRKQVMAGKALTKDPDNRLVVIETPYSASNPFEFLRNLQYAILCNYYANSIYGNTWVPQMCNTQFTAFGLSGYIGDMVGAAVLKFLPSSYSLYDKSREETLRSTNAIRRSRVDKCLVFVDFNISSGMKSGIHAFEKAGGSAEYLRLPPELKRHIIGESFVSTAVPLTLTTTVVAPWTYGMWRLARRVVLRGRA